MKGQLAPGFLVAAPSMRCPFFNHTVVLLVEHDESGALGFVINRPTDTPVNSLLESLEIEGTEVEGDVWVGGPVAPETGWVLFDPDSRSGAREVESMTLTEGLAVTASRALLEALAAGDGPSRYTMLLGYAGWGPGQLDDEIREGSWISVDLDPSLVFDRAPDERWGAALATLGIDPARVVSHRVAEA